MAKVLIVFGHEDSKNSFNAAMKDVAVETLTANGAEVKVSALHDMKFAHFSPEDIVGGLARPEKFNWNYEMAIANEKGTMCDVIRQEQEKVRWADVILYQYPIHALSFPAIVASWNSRTLTPNFAQTNTNFYDTGPMKDKKVLLSMTFAGFDSMMTNKGMMGDINVLLYPMLRSLEFFGFSHYKPQVSYGVFPGNQELCDENLENWRKRLKTLSSEDVMRVGLPRACFDETTFMLSEETVQKYSSDEVGPSVGQNLGKLLPKIV